MTKISLPLDRLNEALDGGIEPGSDVLFVVDLMVNKAEFASALTNYRIEQGDNIVYFLNNKMPQYIEQRLEYDDDDQVTVIDGFSSTLDKETGHQYEIDANLQEDREKYLEEAKQNASNALEAEGSTFIFDSLDPFVGRWDDIKEVIKSVKPVQQEKDAASYYFLPNLGFEEDGEEYEKMKENFDYVMHLKGLERSGIVMKFIETLKPELETKVPYDVTPTGLAMYVPKILVTGPQGSGKTETVHNMSDTAVSTEEMGTTVALDNGQVNKKGIKADIFGTPGEKRFDWAMQFLGRSIFGSFIVVDSRDPDWERAIDIKENLEEKRIPLIVLANFQNKEEAVSTEKIKEKMELETLPVDAKHGKNLEEALDRLMDKILEQHSWY